MISNSVNCLNNSDFPGLDTAGSGKESKNEYPVRDPGCRNVSAYLLEQVEFTSTICHGNPKDKVTLIKGDRI